MLVMVVGVSLLVDGRIYLLFLLYLLMMDGCWFQLVGQLKNCFFIWCLMKVCFFFIMMMFFRFCVKCVMFCGFSGQVMLILYMWMLMLVQVVLFRFRYFSVCRMFRQFLLVVMMFSCVCGVFIIILLMLLVWVNVCVVFIVQWCRCIFWFSGGFGQWMLRLFEGILKFFGSMMWCVIGLILIEVDDLIVLVIVLKLIQCLVQWFIVQFSRFMLRMFCILVGFSIGIIVLMNLFLLLCGRVELWQVWLLVVSVSILLQCEVLVVLVCLNMLLQWFIFGFLLYYMLNMFCMLVLGNRFVCWVFYIMVVFRFLFRLGVNFILVVLRCLCVCYSFRLKLFSGLLWQLLMKLVLLMFWCVLCSCCISGSFISVCMLFRQICFLLWVYLWLSVQLWLIRLVEEGDVSCVVLVMVGLVRIGWYWLCVGMWWERCELQQ